MFSNVIISDVIGLVLRNSDTDSEHISFIQSSVSDGQKTCSSKNVIDGYIINMITDRLDSHTVVNIQGPVVQN